MITADFGKFKNPHFAFRQARGGHALEDSSPVKPMTPMCMVDVAPCAMRRPCASVSAEERSPASLSNGERAERMTITLISSAMA